MANLRDSQNQERALAKQLEGSVSAGSGNGWVHKADVRTEEELYELKITSAKSYALKDKELHKLFTQALMAGRMPVFMVEFLPSHHSYVILSKDDYLELIQRE